MCQHTHNYVFNFLICLPTGVASWTETRRPIFYGLATLVLQLCGRVINAEPVDEIKPRKYWTLPEKQSTMHLSRLPGPFASPCSPLVLLLLSSRFSPGSSALGRVVLGPRRASFKSVWAFNLSSFLPSPMYLWLLLSSVSISTAERSTCSSGWVEV